MYSQTKNLLKIDRRSLSNEINFSLVVQNENSAIMNIRQLSIVLHPRLADASTQWVKLTRNFIGLSSTDFRCHEKTLNFLVQNFFEFFNISKSEQIIFKKYSI